MDSNEKMNMPNGKRNDTSNKQRGYGIQHETAEAYTDDLPTLLPARTANVNSLKERTDEMLEILFGRKRKQVLHTIHEVNCTEG